MEINIYVANLAAYNAGYHKGEWINLPMDEEELNQTIIDILDTSTMSEKAQYEIGNNCEEVAIHDYEAPWKINEYDNIQKLNEIAERLQRLSIYIVDEDMIECLLQFVPDIEEAIDKLEKGDIWFVRGVDSYESLAEHLAYDEDYFSWFYNIKDTNAESYIDWEAVGRDLDVEGEWFIGSNNIAVCIPHCS